MSTRAGRSRFYIGLASLMLMIGFVAIFHSSQQQLDETRQQRLRCEQQQEALNARLQAIIEHKFRVEKSLETERREHLETKQHFELKSKEQKDIHNKATMELTHRYESLQQHYKLLQSEHNDYVEDCSKTKETNLEQINGLERKVKSLQSQLQQSKNQHEKEIEQWRIKYQTLDNEKQRLEVLVHTATSSNDYAVQRYKRTNEKLEKILTEYKSHCDYQPHNDKSLDLNNNNENGNVSPSSVAGVASGIVASESKRPLEINQVKSSKIIEKNFNQQQTINDNLYKIAFSSNLNNNNYNHNNTNNRHELNTNNNNLIGNIGGFGDTAKNNFNNNNYNNRNIIGGIINSVENFQIAPNLLMNADESNNKNNNINGDSKQVLQQPPPLNSPLKSSTASSPLKTPDRTSKGGGGQENHFASIANPTSEKIKRSSGSSSSSTLANNRQKEYAGRLKSKQIPIGVAPVPEYFDTISKNGEDEMNQNESNNNNNNNNKNNNNNDDDNKNININANNNNRYANVVDEQDNGAREINDFNIEPKDVDNVNNAAEDDTNGFMDSKLGVGGGGGNVIGGRYNKKDNDDVEVINNKDKNNNLLEGDDKLIHEVIGDQGKEAPFADGMHLEEPNEEDEDDDYSDPAVRQKEGAAVRN